MAWSGRRFAPPLMSSVSPVTELNSPSIEYFRHRTEVSVSRIMG
jgi:hypothetical protein